MKITSIIISLSVLASTCYSQSDNTIDMVSFTSSTRGGHKLIEVTEQKVSFKLNNDERKYDLEKEDWANLLKLIQEINLNRMEGYPSPSMDRARDAAYHSTLNVKVKDDKSYSSNTFDNQDAPKELSELMSFFVKLDKKYNKESEQLF